MTEHLAFEGTDVFELRTRGGAVYYSDAPFSVIEQAVSSCCQFEVTDRYGALTLLNGGTITAIEKLSAQPVDPRAAIAASGAVADARRLVREGPLSQGLCDDLLEGLAEVGARLCCYAPGAGNPEKWAESTCDCKTMGPCGQSLATTSEMTGCAEVRAAYRAVQARFGR